MADLGFKGERGYSAYEIAVRNGYVGTEESWLAQLGTSTGYKQASKSYTTERANEDQFVLPDEYGTGSILEVYVDGQKLPESEYQINLETRKVILNKPISEIGKKVELQCLSMTITSLPIVQELTESSTENTTPSAKTVYELKQELQKSINDANTLIQKLRVPAGGTQGQVLTKATKEDNSLAWTTLDWLNKIYPVGSIYMNVSSSSPATLFGGTWERIQDRFLLAAGTTYTAGKTGGEATHKLTVNEMPKHVHAYKRVHAWVGNNAASGAVYGYCADGADKTEATGNAGADLPHNNMPPYISVYVWKRTK